MDEAAIALVEAGDPSGLPRRWQVATRMTDALLTDPAGAPRSLRDDFDAELSRPEQLELALTVALASAFSRAAIAWGPPAAMPVLEVPTPAP